MNAQSKGTRRLTHERLWAGFLNDIYLFLGCPYRVSKLVFDKERFVFWTLQ